MGEIVKNHYKTGWFGNDREGRPIAIDCCGTVNFRELEKHGYSVPVMRDFHIWFVERGQELMRMESLKRKQHVHENMVIIDLSGVTMGKVWSALPYLRAFTAVDDMYPTLHKLVMINSPPGFASMFSLVKPILGAETVAKFEIFGTEGYTQRLLELVDKDQLPQSYGGTAQDPPFVLAAKQKR